MCYRLETAGQSAHLQIHELLFIIIVLPPYQATTAEEPTCAITYIILSFNIISILLPTSTKMY